MRDDSNLIQIQNQSYKSETLTLSALNFPIRISVLCAGEKWLALVKTQNYTTQQVLEIVKCFIVPILTI